MKDKFDKTFMKSRIPYAIFTYAGNFINNSEMKPVIKRFIVGVLDNTYLIDRHNNNSHKHLLSEPQKLEWEKGQIENLDSSGLKEMRFNPLLFLTTTFITNNHGGGNLREIKRSYFICICY